MQALEFLMLIIATSPQIAIYCLQYAYGLIEPSQSARENSDHSSRC